MNPLAIPLALVLSVLTACGGDAAPAPRPTDAVTSTASTPGGPATSGGDVRYLALGDSVTSGEGVPPEESYPSRLAALWRSDGCAVEVRNVAVTGYKSADVIADELPVVAEFKPTLVTLMVGANDMANAIGVEEYRANLRTIFAALKDSGAAIVTVSMQFWERTPFAEGYGTREELAANRAEFDAALIAEGQSAGAQHVDLGAVFAEQADKKMWLEDGLHPTGAAYQGWAAALHARVAKPCEPS